MPTEHFQQNNKKVSCLGILFLKSHAKQMGAFLKIRTILKFQFDLNTKLEEKPKLSRINKKGPSRVLPIRCDQFMCVAAQPLVIGLLNEYIRVDPHLVTSIERRRCTIYVVTARVICVDKN